MNINLKGTDLMKKELEKIIYENFNISECIVYAQSYKGELQHFSTRGNTRKICGFLYLLNCDCTYELIDETEINAQTGDVVYLRAFCEYKSNYKNFGNGAVDGILINMRFTDADGKVFYLSDEMKSYKISSSSSNYIRACFDDILNFSKSPQTNIAEIKSAAYKILSYLGTKDKKHKINSGRYKCISKGIAYLENDVRQELSIEEIADLCHMTATYFRKLFKEYSGTSPAQFRIQKKLDTAKALLLTDDMTIREISDYLGFENISYFSKLFKKYEKMSPSQYKTKNSKTEVLR